MNAAYAKTGRFGGREQRCTLAARHRPCGHLAAGRPWIGRVEVAIPPDNTIDANTSGTANNACSSFMTRRYLASLVMTVTCHPGPAVT